MTKSATAITKESVQEALKSVKYPGFSRDIISFGLVDNILISPTGSLSIHLKITTADAAIPEKIKHDIEHTLADRLNIKDCAVVVSITEPKKRPGATDNHPASAKPEALAKVKYAIAVSSGKGGVGKSTVAVNLACALEKLLTQRGLSKKVGLMDCDIYGPSTPIMLGVNRQPEIEGNSILPLENFGVKVMSMGFLIDEDAPVVWRGPMIMKTIQQFAMNVAWGELEVLVVDLPPGTGDAQLSVVQTIPLDGAIVVTTPQAVAVNVARRGARMFEKVNVPLLGVIENMSYLENEKGDRNYLFGQGGGTETARMLKTEVLGEVPLLSEVRIGGDRGIPIVVSHEESKAAKIFEQIAQVILKKLENKA